MQSLEGWDLHDKSITVGPLTASARSLPGGRVDPIADDNNASDTEHGKYTGSL